MMSLKFFEISGHTYGYSPYHLGGYIAGIYQSIDNHLVLIFELVLSKILNPAFVYNLAIFLAYLFF